MIEKVTQIINSFQIYYNSEIPCYNQFLKYVLLNSPFEYCCKQIWVSNIIEASL